MPTPQITFALRKDGYALLTLDQLTRVEDQRQTNSRKGMALSVPPLPTPLADQTPEQKRMTTGINRTWYIFFENLLKRLQSTGRDLSELKFLAPSIDEEDIRTYGTGTLDASTNPATFTPDLSKYSSRYGVTFASGDYIAWEDGEIDQIATIGGGNWTVERGHFKSTVAAHDTKRFWRLEPKQFSVELPDGTLPPFVQFPWANKCVVAIRAWGKGVDGDGIEYTLNLAGEDAPGWRTMNGAAYTNLGVGGTLAVNQRAAYRIKVQAWESVRCAYAYVKTPSTGADIVVSTVYIAPGDTESIRPVGLIDRVTIPAGSYESFLMSDPPDGRQMPYGSSYPPNLLPYCGGLGALAAPVTPTAGDPVVFAPDGEIDFVIEQVGSEGTEGADLMLTVQT